MIRRVINSLLVLPLLASAAIAAPFPGQGQGQGRRQNQQAQREQQARRQQQQRNNQSRNLAGLPPKWEEHLQDMTPEEQERFMKNNERFRQLSPDGQAQIRDKLRYWNGLSPDEREGLRDRQRVWEQLSPAQQDHIQHDLLPKWQQLPQDRRQVILSRLRGLSSMSDADRAAKLNDPQYMRGLSPDEQDMLKNLSMLRAGSPGAPAPSVPAPSVSSPSSNYQ
jgi:hypothetical protein